MMTEFPAIKRISTLPHYQPTYERKFALMGETLLFQTNHRPLLDAAEDAFGRFPLSEFSSTEPLVVRLFVNETTSNQLGPQGRGIPRPIFSTQGHIFTITAGTDNLGVADLLQCFACGYISPRVAANQAFVRYTFIEGLSLAMLSMGRDYVPIHAACVVKDGTAVILQACAGTGKSTLAYACLQRGYKLLAEDVVHVKIGAQQLQLWGVPWKFHLLPDAKDLFPELAAERARLQMNHEWKLELDLDEHFPGSATVCAEPGSVVLLQRCTSGGTGVEHLTPMQAHRKFEVLWPWDSGWTETHDKKISKLLTKGAYILHMNGSPDEAVDKLDQLLEKF